MFLMLNKFFAFQIFPFIVFITAINAYFCSPIFLYEKDEKMVANNGERS